VFSYEINPKKTRKVFNKKNFYSTVHLHAGFAFKRTISLDDCGDEAM
jgi:hypothetical protein